MGARKLRVSSRFAQPTGCSTWICGSWVWVEEARRYGSANRKSRPRRRGIATCRCRLPPLRPVFCTNNPLTPHWPCSDATAVLLADPPESASCAESESPELAADGARPPLSFDRRSTGPCVDRHLVVSGIRHTVSAAIVTSLSADTASGGLPVCLLLVGGRTSWGGAKASPVESAGRARCGVESTSLYGSGPRQLADLRFQAERSVIG